MSDPAAILEARPKRVALIALGNTSDRYRRYIHWRYATPWDHVWVVNCGLAVWRHDIAWVMDDFETFVGTEMPHAAALLKDAEKPIITSTAHPDFPMTVSYPIKDVVQRFGDDLFTTTVDYALAWALYIGVEWLDLFGCDFTYPTSKEKETGSMSAAYWCGRLRQAGCIVEVTPESTFLRANEADSTLPHRPRPMYGYPSRPVLVNTGTTVGKF